MFTVLMALISMVLSMNQNIQKWNSSFLNLVTMLQIYSKIIITRKIHKKNLNYTRRSLLLDLTHLNKNKRRPLKRKIMSLKTQLSMKKQIQWTVLISNRILHQSSLRKMEDQSLKWWHKMRKIKSKLSSWDNNKPLRKQLT